MQNATGQLSKPHTNLHRFRKHSAPTIILATPSHSTDYPSSSLFQNNSPEPTLVGSMGAGHSLHSSSGAQQPGIATEGRHCSSGLGNCSPSVGFGQGYIAGWDRTEMDFGYGACLFCLGVHWQLC